MTGTLPAADASAVRRAALEARRRQLDEEIRTYPAPIPRCDAQFNHLYEERARIVEELEKLPQPPTMAIQGVSHITFIVRDLERMARVLCEGLGAQEVYDSDGRNFSLSREKFFVLGGVWIAAMEGESPKERGYRHVAFKVAEPDLPEFERRLRAIGVDVKEPRPRVEGEGLSLYFYDFDNHLFELHTGTLGERLERYRR